MQDKRNITYKDQIQNRVLPIQHIREIEEKRKKIQKKIKIKI